MTRRIIGARYGADALARLREVVAEAKAGDPMAPVTVLVPNNIAGIVARRHLAAGVDERRPGIAGIRISTLSRLADEIAAPTLAPRRPATRAVVAAAWRAALDEQPGLFAEVASHAATIEALVRAHRELRDVHDEALTGIARRGGVPGEVVRLHRAVVDRLRSDWYDEVDLLLAAAAAPGLGRRVGGALVLHLPQVLGTAERSFVGALEAGADLTVIAGVTGVRRADREVFDGIDTSRERLALDRKPTATRIHSSSDSDDEVRCLARAVLADLREVPAHRIAVLYAAEKPYARLLHERFAAVGIIVNGRGVRPVAERSSARALLELLALADQDVPRIDLFRAIAAVPMRDFDGTRIPLSTWDRISRAAGVVKADDWTTRLDQYLSEQSAVIEAEASNPASQPWRAERAQEQIAAATALGAFITRLREELRRGAALHTWRDLSAWALELYGALIADDRTPSRLPAEEQYAAAAVLTCLRGLADLDGLERHADMRALRDVLQTELDASRPRVGTFGTGVFVGPLSDAIGLAADRIHIVGVAEDLYPGRLGEDPLLPEVVRDASNGSLASLRRRLNDRHRALLAAFQSAEAVTVSVPRGDLRRSTRRLPSRWLLHTLRDLAGDVALTMSDWDRADYRDGAAVSGSFAGELLSTQELADEQEWRTRAIAAGIETDDGAVLAARSLLRGRASDGFTRFDGNLGGSDGLPDLLRDSITVSPTALEGYAICPHAYFVERLLGVRPLDRPEETVAASPADIGNLIHESLDDLVRAASEAGELPQDGAPWTPLQHDLLQEIARRKAEEFARRGLTGHPRLWAGELERIHTDLARLLIRDDEKRAERGASVLVSELAFGMRGRPPVEIPVPGGRVLMKGSADRVDRGADGTLYVIDVKTGSSRKFQPIKRPDNRLVNGTKLQLPVYAHAARQHYKEQFGDPPVQAEYWFVRRNPERIALPLEEVEAQYAETLAVLARSLRSGVFPQRPPEKPDYSWVQCGYCNPDAIGHGEARERWLRKRSDAELTAYVGLVEPEGVAR